MRAFWTLTGIALVYFGLYALHPGLLYFAVGATLIWNASPGKRKP